MATTTALLSATGRRLPRSSASSIVWREVSGRHTVTIDGYAPSWRKPWDWSVTSTAFKAAGYSWRITFYPNGASCVDDDYVSLYLELDGGGGPPQTDQVGFSFTLLDLAGNPVPQHSRSKERCFFYHESPREGFLHFAKWRDLVASGCLRDNRGFTVQCDITVIKEWTKDNVVAADGAAALARVVVPPSNLHKHLNALLWKKQGAGVTIHVGAEVLTYDAHGWLLAARSPVFEAELLAATKEKATGSVRRRMEVKDMEPEVFKAMLHFMYTDTLPEMEGRDAVAMAQGLLVAAHRYKLERLKLMCEEMLCKHIDVGTVASTLAVAEQYGCHVLKAACVEFIAFPGNLKAVMETEGYLKIKANCPTVLIEFALKQLA